MKNKKKYICLEKVKENPYLLVDKKIKFHNKNWKNLRSIVKIRSKVRIKRIYIFLFNEKFKNCITFSKKNNKRKIHHYHFHVISEGQSVYAGLARFSVGAQNDTCTSFQRDTVTGAPLQQHSPPNNSSLPTPTVLRLVGNESSF